MNIKKIILDTIFPIYCVGCDKEGVWFCEKCFQKIHFKLEQVCPICKKIIVPGGKICFDCKCENDIDGILVASFYKKNKEKTILAKLIHYHKYRFALELSTVLGKILEKSILNSALPLPEIIIPVPLHHRRLRWRGFNQAQLLAEYLGENITPGFPLPVYPTAILRNRYTKPQMEIKNREKRQINTLNAFELNTKEIFEIKDKVIFLVDDLVTTGSTLFECAKVLKKSGAKKVYGVVLARQ